MSCLRRCCVMALLVMLPSSSLWAYVPSRTTKSQRALRWMGTNKIVLRPTVTGSDDLPEGEHIAAIERSANNWHDAIGEDAYIRFDILEASDDAEKRFNREGCNENAVLFIESDWDHASAAAGITTVFFVDEPSDANDGRILDADVELNGEFFTFTTDDAGVMTDLENTLTHELGHVLGLDHPCNDGSRDPVPTDNEGNDIPDCEPFSALPDWMRQVTMFNVADPGETIKRTPEADDVLGVTDAYPTEDDPNEGGPFCFDDGGGDDGGGCTAVNNGLFNGLIALLFGATILRFIRRRVSRSRL